MRKFFTTFAIAILGISPATLTHAALITQDFSDGSGDALLTYDSDTGLEWLDTTITDGRSFTEVKAGWGGWTTTSGFRYATMAELRRLFVSAGVMPNFLYDTYSTPSDITEVDRIIALTRLLGPTFIYEDEGSPLQRRSVMGFVADDYSDNPDYAGFGRYADVGFYQLGWTTYAWAQDGSSTQVQRSGQYGGLGSFLVRESVITPVPEPTTLALSGVALLVLLALRRNEKPISKSLSATSSGHVDSPSSPLS